MRVAWPILVPLVFGCATRPAAAPSASADSTSIRIMSERVRVASPDGSSRAVADFVPAVAAIAEGGECKTIAIEPGQRLILLSFPTFREPQRNVSLTVDPTGNLLNYSDVRGDLGALRPQERTGPLTAVTITVGQGIASATNEWPNRPAEVVLGAPADFMAAENLGRPDEMVKLIMARCAAPSAAPSAG